MNSLPIGYRFGAVLLVLLAVSPWLPPWLLFMLTIASANGLVVLGCMLFYRAGLVSFGQALYFCTGAYTTGLVTNLLGVTDVLLLLGLSGLTGGVLAFLVGFLLARYRGIFFGLLSMAFSMILYGVLTKTESLGSTDGFNVPAFTLLGFEPDQPQVRFTLLAVAVVVIWLVSLVADRFLRSPYGPCSWRFTTTRFVPSTWVHRPKTRCIWFTWPRASWRVWAAALAPRLWDT